MCHIAGGRKTNNGVHKVLDRQRGSRLAQVKCGLKMAEDRVMQLRKTNVMVSLSHRFEF